MKSYTFAIGVPAYNESKSIANTLTALCSQQVKKQFIKKGIFVYSDASTDDTEQKVLSVRNKTIHIITSPKRMGKAHAVKKLIYNTQSQKIDFLILVDADLRIKDKYMVSKLLDNISSDEDIAATSGSTFPLQPENFVQRIGYVGHITWKYLVAKNGEKEKYFRSSDNFVALRVKDFPKRILEKYFYIHDEYYYLYCRKYNKKFSFEKKALGYFVLPNNLPDYVAQMSRYVSQHMSEKERKILGVGFSFSGFERLHALLICGKNDKIAAFVYLIIQLYIRLKTQNTLERFNSIWPQITSTKSL